LYYALTRILMGMANDGLLPPYFARVDKKRQTPVNNTILCGVIMMVMAGLFPLGALVQLVNIGTLAAFVMVCVGVIVLRRTKPDMHRPFKMPFGIVLPVLGIMTCGALIVFLPWITQLRFIGWLGIGWTIYFCYSIRHSKMRINI
jgi:APA family basic amino acid/polyamine antiporter